MAETPPVKRSATERSIFFLVVMGLITQLAVVALLVRSLHGGGEQSGHVSRVHIASLSETDAIRKELERMLELPQSPPSLRALDLRASLRDIEVHIERLESIHRSFDAAEFRGSLAGMRAEYSRAVSSLRPLLPGRQGGQGSVEEHAAIEATLVKVIQLEALHREAAFEESLQIQQSWVGESIKLLGLTFVAVALITVLIVRTVRVVGRRAAERDLSEEKLRRSEERLRLLLDSSYDMVCEYDLNGTLYFANKRMAETRGYEPEELLSLADWADWGGLHPDDVAESWSKLAQAIQTGLPVETEGRIQHKDGSWIWTQSTSIPYRTPEGEMHLVSLGRDVTATHNEKEKRQRLAKIIELSSDSIALVDLDGHLTYLNAAARKLAGLSAEIGPSQIPIAEFAQAGDWSEGWNRIISLCQAKEGCELETTIRQQGTGSAIPVHYKGFFLYDSAGDPVSVAIVARDLTQIKLAELERAQLMQKSAQSERMESLGMLAGGIAHDFNNLLSGVLINAGIALASSEPESPASASIARVEEAARQMAGLANQLLAYAGAHQVSTEPVNLAELIDALIGSIGGSISGHARLVLDLAPKVIADVNAAQITQLAMNLIVNASESLPDAAGEIRVSLKRVENARASSWCEILPEAEGVLLEVSDTGCGMSEKTRQRIFEPLFSTKKGGRGLGLAATEGILKSIGGEIHIKSEVGKGTKALVFIPGPAPVVSAEIPSLRPDLEVPEHSVKILVVDDERIPRESLTLLLRQHGFSVANAADAGSAIKHVLGQDGEIDLALLDLSMPDMSGIELFKTLRGISPALRGVLCSGYPRSQAMERYEEAGFEGFLQKPYEIDALLAMVAKNAQ